MATTPIISDEVGHHALEFVISLFFITISALGVVFRLYIGRVTSKLDQIGKRLEAHEQDATSKYNNVAEKNAARELEVEKRLTRLEVLEQALAEHSHKVISPPERNIELGDN